MDQLFAQGKWNSLGVPYIPNLPSLDPMTLDTVNMKILKMNWNTFYGVESTPNITSCRRCFGQLVYSCWNIFKLLYSKS